MPTDKTIIEQMLDRQRRVFRIAQDPARYGLTLKLIAADAQLGYDSVRNYASGDTQMPLTALYALVGVIPDELLSLLLPDGRQIVAVPANMDPDQVESACRDFLADKGKAHHPESPAGREISDCEAAALSKRVAHIVAVAA